MLTLCLQRKQLLLVLATAVAIAYSLLPNEAKAQAQYADPDKAVGALVEALRNDDTKALQVVFGNSTKGLVESGDRVADGVARHAFLTAYDKKSKIVNDGEERAQLIVGEDDWPFPIPMVLQGGAWHFDTVAGADELLNRRIGRNELNTIEASLAYVDAQRDYATFDRDGDGILEYAQKFLSQPGQMDGLYWPDQTGRAESPLGPLFASARSVGYSKEDADEDTAYYGYRYRILTKQGKKADGGATDYMVNGNMMGGFALVAFPANYGTSGVMTFIVNNDGAVYQADLGPDTTGAAEKMAEFNPDPKVWKKVKREK